MVAGAARPAGRPAARPRRPTRWPSASATPTTRRCAAVHGGRPMIALVAGEVAVRRPDHVVIETASGVGYRLAVSAETLRQVPGRGRAGLAAHAPGRPRRRAVALRLRHRGGARPLPAADRRAVGRAEGGAQAVLSGGSPRELIARAGRRRRRSGSPPSRASASARPSGSSSSCARRSATVERRAGDGRRSPSAAATTRGCWRATASSSSASPSPRPSGCSRGADGRHARGRCCSRRCGRRAHDRRAHPDARRGLRGGRSTARCGPRALRGLRRPGRPQGPAVGLAGGRAAARRGAGPRPAGRPARPGQDVAGADPRRRARGPVRPDRRPGAGAQGRHRARSSTALEPRSIFFVDEIHRLSRALEETFYPAMEDRKLPITVGQGAGARVVT